MRDPILLGDGDAPDVCALASGWLVAWQPVLSDHRTRGPLTLSWFTTDGRPQVELTIDMGHTDGGTFPKLMVAAGRAWLAYRAHRAGIGHGVVREVRGQSLTPETLLGRAGGNAPIALSPEWIAWQDIPGGVTRGQPLAGGASIVLRGETRPTGLAYLRDGSWPVFVDDNRVSVRGMYNPVLAGACTVGEGLYGGIAVIVGGKTGLLMPGQFCGTPRVAQRKRDEYAAVCWGPVRLILFAAADIAGATTNKPTPTKERTMIAYSGPVPGFLAGQLEPHPHGSDELQVRKPNGKLLTVTPDGQVEERDAAGSWESFRRGKGALIAERGDRLYVLPMVE